MDGKQQRNQYHPSFCAALELELRKNKRQISCEKEHVLNTKPNSIDLLVKVEDNVVMESGLGVIFKKCNLIEYKSPRDTLNQRIYHRMMGYVNLYIAYADEAYCMDEMTVTFIRESMPRKLMKQFAEEGFTIRQYEPGIYHLTKTDHVDMQIIVVRQLGKEYKWLTKLTDRVEWEDMTDLVEEIRKLEDEQDKINAESVFDLMARLNRDKEWMKEVFAMGAFRDLFKEEFEKRDHMIEEQNDKIQELENQNKQQKEQLQNQSEQLQNQSEQLQNQSEQLQNKEEENSKLKEEIAQLKKQLGRIAMF